MMGGDNGAVDFVGGVPERSKGADCKSAGSAFGGSNPPPSTTIAAGGGGRVGIWGEICAAGVVQRLEPQPSKLMMWVRFPSPAPIGAAISANMGRRAVGARVAAPRFLG